MRVEPENANKAPVTSLLIQKVTMIEYNEQQANLNAQVLMHKH